MTTERPARRCSTHSRGARIAKTKGPTHNRGRLWAALRILRNTTIDELLAVAEQDNRNSVVIFLSQLRRAGYVHTHYGNFGRREHNRYTLIRNTGPRCPSLTQRAHAFWDHNTETEYPFK